MQTSVILPTPSGALRILITASGYRPYFVKIGADKDLDDLALEKRKGNNFDLLQDCQAQWLRSVRDDCGAGWSNLFESAWQRHSNILQSLARNADTTGMIAEHARQVLHRMLIIPELSGVIRRIDLQIKILDVQSWFECPFATWLRAVSECSGLAEEKLRERMANHLDVDERTLERWCRGDPIKKGLWPYRATTQTMLFDSGLNAKKIEYLTGWLAITVAVQSLSVELRAEIRKDFTLQDLRNLKNEQQLISHLKGEAADRSSLFVCDQVAQVIPELNRLFINARANEQPIRNRLDWLHSLCERNTPAIHAAHEYLWLWFSAKLAANLAEKETALNLYARACSKAWWRAGSNQHAILHEALCYAVGVGDKVQANHYWDKCFLLGLNNPPKKELDEQNLRRISFEFERIFSPQKAKQRIPPARRIVDMSKPFSLSAKELANPNRITAQADGRVRYTPFMNAVLLGTLRGVKQATDAGADPNIVIPESGENALIMALRRACDRKDPDILQYILTLNISVKTVNQPASSKRETPLHIAINMGDANVVARLIALGADIEQPCFTSPSALVYAMAVLHDSKYKDDPSQRNAYFEGRVPADSFDAKGGAIFDCELATQRKARMSLFEQPKNKSIFDADISHYNCAVESRRQVVMTLLENKADPNRRYADFNGNQSMWTPTLFSAQVGDLEVLKAMINAGGDPWLSMDDASPLDDKNALWVAVTYERHAVIEYLQTLLSKH